MSAVTQCRHRCCFANAGEDLVSEMPYQIRKVETCNSPCVVTSREEEEGNLDLCCRPAGRDLTGRLPSQLYLGPKSHLFKAKLPPFAARSLARVNTADVGLCPISFCRRRIDCSVGKPMLQPRIPPLSVLPKAQTQVSELLQGLEWFGGILRLSLSVL